LHATILKISGGLGTPERGCRAQASGTEVDVPSSKRESARKGLANQTAGTR